MIKIVIGESTELKLKAKELFNIFPKIFDHIKLTDVLFFRIDESGHFPLIIKPVNEDPYKYIVPYKYIIIAYKEFDELTINLQFQALAHKLLCIPKHYKIKNVLKIPDIVMHKEEEEIADWMQTHEFTLKH